MDKKHPLSFLEELNQQRLKAQASLREAAQKLDAVRPEITSGLELSRCFTIWVPSHLLLGDIANVLGEAGIQATVYGGTEAQWVAVSRPRSQTD